MEPFSRGALIQCKQPADRSRRPGSGSRQDERLEPRGPDLEEFVLCRFCRIIITHPDHVIAVQGGHEHAFANPHGKVFQIGCFRSAVGCGHVGSPTDEFTWFRGFRWRIALCGNCLNHLGWQFTSFAGERFHGLILDRLLFPGG